jgi:hypothetical protein
MNVFLSQGSKSHSYLNKVDKYTTFDSPSATPHLGKENVQQGTSDPSYLWYSHHSQ